MIVFPNAKIKIGLFVVEKRSDGFHNLETVFCPIGLSDILEIQRKEGKSGEYEFKNTGIEVGGVPEANLIVKAYRLLAEEYSLPAVYIHLHKVIPFGAGLGGGSSDAAFMLKALNEYFELNLSQEKMMEYASRLGSDCAFFITGRPAFASGKGEVLEELSLDLKKYRIVLLKPEFGVSTPEAYAGITPAPARCNLRELPDCPLDAWRDKVGNDFEKTVGAKYPRIMDLKRDLYESGALYAAMTGSGSAVFGIFAQEIERQGKWDDCWFWQGDFI